MNFIGSVVPAEPGGGAGIGGGFDGINGPDYPGVI